MQKNKKITVYDIVTVGLMAAMIFAATRFLSVQIPTPTGTTMLKVANALCLCGGILFGGLRGGLAAGIGSMLFDLTDPQFAAGAWLTFILFFLMAFICGTISHAGGAKGAHPKRNVVATVVGALSYTTLYATKSIVTLMIGGSAFAPALIAVLPKIATSLVNAGFAIVVACVLSPVLRRALVSIHYYDKMTV